MMFTYVHTFMIRCIFKNFSSKLVVVAVAVAIVVEVEVLLLVCWEAKGKKVVVVLCG